MKEKEALLEVRSLCVRYPGNEKEILHQVDMTVLPGTITCVIGESGSGKSTLLQAILQLPGKVEITPGRNYFLRTESPDNVRNKAACSPWQQYGGRVSGAWSVPESDPQDRAAVL